MTVIAYITEAAVVAKILRHLGMPTCPPEILPARLPAQVEMFEDDGLRQAWACRPRRGGRDPPRQQEGETLFEHDASHGDWAA